MNIHEAVIAASRCICLL